MRDEVVLGGDAEAPVAEPILQLLIAISQNGIDCCYWKSSRRLPAAMSGDSDLDLLVPRREQHRLQECLLAAGFKLFPAIAGRSDPSTLSYLGYDEHSGRIVHVHLHMRLVAGSKLLPEYRLPWEETLLDWSIPHPGLPIRILDPAAEAIMLIVRSALELRRGDPVVAHHWQAMREKFETDRRALALRVDRKTLRERAQALMGPDLADPVVNALTDEEPLERQQALRRQIRQRLADFRRFNSLEGAIWRLVRTLVLAGGIAGQRVLHLPRPWRRRAPGGGIVVALLGVDGSGKSTARARITQWLAPEVDIMPIYFGTGDGRPSLILLPLKLLVPLYSRFRRSKPKGASHGNVSERPPGLLYTALLTLWSSVLAVEKRQKLLQARRGAERGLVVIADRYPQDQIETFNDGPLLPRLKGIPQWLRQFEARAYGLAGRLAPDLVIILTATPELIVAREPSMDRAVIRQRLGELARLDFPASRVVCVDAGQPLEEVIRQIKSEIWRAL